MPILEVEGLYKSFGGLMAIKNLNFAVNEGEIVGLIGPNGSGKTTSFNLISGLYKPNNGKIRFDNKDITGLKPHQICQAGIARTFQLIQPFLRMSPLQNVMVGRAYGSQPVFSMKQARAESEEILAFTGLSGKKVPTAGMLGLVDRKRLEIARALATKPRLLLLDEMMSGLNVTETEEAMGLVRKIRDSGITLVVVEHVMRVVWGISDRVIVLNVGEKIAEGTPKEIASNRQVIEAYLGEDEYA
jgi:branched-chain amino acid transport system ATP-binding protein